MLLTFEIIRTRNGQDFELLNDTNFSETPLIIRLYIIIIYIIIWYILRLYVIKPLGFMCRLKQLYISQHFFSFIDGSTTYDWIYQYSFLTNVFSKIIYFSCFLSVISYIDKMPRYWYATMIKVLASTFFATGVTVKLIPLEHTIISPKFQLTSRIKI